MKRAALVVLFVALVAAPVGATPLVDQAFDDISLYNLSTSIGNGEPFAKAQTFTVGMSGIFSGIDMPISIVRISGLNPNAPLIVDIRPTSNGIPLENNLSSIATVSVLPSQVAPSPLLFMHIDFSSFNFSVTAGDVLAIVLRSNTTAASAGYYAFSGANKSPYTGGNFYFRTVPSPTHTGTFTLFESGSSLFFRTYVGEGSIPTGTIMPPPFPPTTPPNCSAAQAYPGVLWSPNHQFVPVVVMGVTDPDGDSVTITVTGVTQDEPVNAKGDGNKSPDALIQAGAASVRAERSGTGNGRVYQISFRAEDGKGGSCTGAVTVGVPHSLKNGLTAIDDGQAYDSTVGKGGHGQRPPQYKDRDDRD